MSSFRDHLEGNIDFHGQKKADDMTRIALISSTILSFVLGFALQSVRVSMGTFALATVVLALVVLPPWRVYNAHPVQWLSAQAIPSKSK